MFSNWTPHFADIKGTEYYNVGTNMVESEINKKCFEFSNKSWNNICVC